MSIENCVKKNKRGKVFLIGAGPGDSGLLTIKAKKILETADIILYDHLVSREIIRQIKNKNKIKTGKRKKKDSFIQTEINRLLLKYASEKKTIARLKGGDPFIFGRGGDEIEFLVSNGISCEVIPGITAAQAAAACIRIPFTKRGVSSSVIFCTGHPIHKAYIPDKNFPGTIIFYMAAATINKIIKKFLEKGWDKNTSIAVIQNATLPEQKIYIGNFKSIVKRKKGFLSPTIIMIGRVVNHQRNKNREKT